MKLDSTGLRYWMKPGISLGKRNELSRSAKWNHVNCIVDFESYFNDVFIEIIEKQEESLNVWITGFYLYTRI